MTNTKLEVKLTDEEKEYLNTQNGFEYQGCYKRFPLDNHFHPLITCNGYHTTYIIKSQMKKYKRNEIDEDVNPYFEIRYGRVSKWHKYHWKDNLNRWRDRNTSSIDLDSTPKRFDTLKEAVEFMQNSDKREFLKTTVTLSHIVEVDKDRKSDGIFGQRYAYLHNNYPYSMDSSPWNLNNFRHLLVFKSSVIFDKYKSMFTRDMECPFNYEIIEDLVIEKLERFLPKKRNKAWTYYMKSANIVLVAAKNHEIIIGLKFNSEGDFYPNSEEILEKVKGLSIEMDCWKHLAYGTTYKF